MKTQIDFARALTCCVLLWSSGGFAQTALHHRENVREYQLGPGDQISIHVTDLDEFENRTVRIDPDGMLDLPLIGAVRAEDETITHLRAELKERLSRYITNPEISITVTENMSRPVAVNGSVNHAGVFQVQGPRRLMDIIALAGGTSQDAGPSVVVTRAARWGAIEAPDVPTRRDGEYTSVTISLDDVSSGRKPAQNILIQPNDTVSVPKADLIYVLGDVKKAGGFTLSRHESMTVLEAISLAEGFSGSAARSRLRLLRKPPGGDGTPQQIDVDAKKILEGKEPDIPMYANDVLFVPNNAAREAGKVALAAAISIGTGVLIYRR